MSCQKGQSAIRLLPTKRTFSLLSLHFHFNVSKQEDTFHSNAQISYTKFISPPIPLPHYPPLHFPLLSLVLHPWQTLPLHRLELRTPQQHLPLRLPRGLHLPRDNRWLRPHHRLPPPLLLRHRNPTVLPRHRMRKPYQHGFQVHILR